MTAPAEVEVDYDVEIADALTVLEADREVVDWPGLLSVVQQIRDGSEFGPRLALAYLRQYHREAKRRAS